MNYLQKSSLVGAKSLVFTIPVQEFRSLPIPSIPSGKLGSCYVSASDVPEALDAFMSVNPRTPNRNKSGMLSGPVIKGIVETLTQYPDDMSIKNQGIYLLVEDAVHTKSPGGHGMLTVTLSDTDLHGIINGGHTFAAIRDTIENADDVELQSIARAHVRLHLMSGIDADKVPLIAEGLNRSKQVDDPSLENLKHHFVAIKKSLEGKLGENSISYHQGDDGDNYITEILVFLEMFNGERFDARRHPNSLYNSPKNGLKYYTKDLENSPSAIDILVPKLHEILQLADFIRQATPSAAKKVGFEFGRMKIGSARTGSIRHKDIDLPFIGKKMDHRVPNGWLYPMLAAFRANMIWDLDNKKFEWMMPLDALLPQVMEDLVGVCVTAHSDNIAPEKVGKRESIYVQCHDKVKIKLFELGIQKVQ